MAPASLRWVLDTWDIHRVAFLKIDCEGCEWQFLDSPDIDRVDHIVGEYHIGDLVRLMGLLGGTHIVETWNEEGGFGMFRAVLRG